MFDILQSKAMQFLGEYMAYILFIKFLISPCRQRNILSQISEASTPQRCCVATFRRRRKFLWDKTKNVLQKGTIARFSK